MQYLGLKDDAEDLITVSDIDDSLAVGTNVLPPGFYFDQATELEKVIAHVAEPPTGSGLVIEVRDDGVLITTLTIASGTTTAEATVTHSIGADSLITADITQVGATQAGKDLSINLVVASSGGDHADADHSDAFEPLGTVNTHANAADPHPIYLTQDEGDARYAAIGAGGSVDTDSLLAVPGATVKLVYMTTTVSGVASDGWYLPDETTATLTGRQASILWEGTSVQIPDQGPGDADFHVGDTAFVRASSL